MISRPHVGAGPLLCLSAFLAPLGSSASVPILGLPLAAFPLAALVVLALVDWLRGIRPSIPFDLAWPAVLLLPALPMAHGAMALKLALAVPVFLATLHFAVTRPLILRALWYFCCASGIRTILELAAVHTSFLDGSLPMAFAPESGVACFFSTNGSAAFTEAALAVALVVALLFSRDLSIGKRLCLASTAVPLVLWLIHAIPPTAQALRATGIPALPGSAHRWIPALLLLWIVARVLARLLVARLEDKPGIHLGLVAVLALAPPLVLLPNLQLSLPMVVLFTLLAAYARPLQTQNASPAMKKPLVAGAVAAVATLAALHGGFYGTWTAPANLIRAEAHLATLKTGGPAWAVRNFLLLSKHYNPAASHFWNAELALERGAPLPGAEAFALSLQARPSDNATTLFGEERIAAFLERLRDVCSAVPMRNRGVAYERALIACGKQPLALASLKLFARAKPRPAPDARPLAKALAMLLGDATVEKELVTWGGETLLGVFEGLGATIWKDTSQDSTIVLTALAMNNGLLIRGVSEAGRFGGWRKGEARKRYGEITGWRNTPARASLINAQGERVVTVRVDSAPEVRFLQKEDASFHTPGLTLTVRVP